MAKEENLRYGYSAGEKESIHYIGKTRGTKIYLRKLMQAIVFLSFLMRKGLRL